MKKLKDENTLINEKINEIVDLFNHFNIEMNVKLKELNNLNFDPETGYTPKEKLDIDILMVSKPKTQRDKMMHLMDILSELDKGEGVPLKKVIKEDKKEGIDEHFVRRYLEEFKQRGDLYEPKKKFYKLLR